MGTTPEMEVEYALANRTRDGMPLLVTVAALPTTVRENRPNLLIARLPYKERPNGLPAGNELNRVGRLEEALSVSLVQKGAVHVGHFTGGGQMVAAWYGPTGIPTTHWVRTGLLSRQEIVLESRADGAWLWYDNELSLSPYEHEASRNCALLEKLSQMGDVASRVRPVDFTFFFDEEAQRQVMLSELLAEGFRIGEEGCWTSDGHSQPYGMTVCLDTSIEEETIARICASLRVRAEGHQADFDGWATPLAH